MDENILDVQENKTIKGKDVSLISVSPFLRMYSPSLDSDLSMPKGGGRFRGSKSNNVHWGEGNLSLFKDIESNLCRLIREWGKRGKFIFMAMAWFTKSNILKALLEAQKRGALVAVLLTKDDVWRSDLWTQNDPRWRGARRHVASASLQTYASFRCYRTDDFIHIIERHAPGVVYGIESPLCYVWKEEYEHALDFPMEGTTPIRCFGNYKDNERMHNKFIVFGNQYGRDLQPLAVWKGSFNVTYTATKSKESVEYIRNEDSARAHLHEFCTMYLKSEPFLWTSKVMKPAFYKTRDSNPLRPLPGVPTLEELKSRHDYYEDWWAPFDQVPYIFAALLGK